MEKLWTVTDPQFQGQLIWETLDKHVILWIYLYSINHHLHFLFTIKAWFIISPE